MKTTPSPTSTARDAGQTNQAVELARLTPSKMHARPIFIDGIMQESLRELTAPCEMLVNGLPIRVGAGTVVCLISSGFDERIGGMAAGGKLLRDLRVRCLDGVTRILPACEISIPLEAR